MKITSRDIRLSRVRNSAFAWRTSSSPPAIAALDHPQIDNAHCQGARRQIRTPRPCSPRIAAAKGDALLEALLTELDRSKAQLKMDQVAAALLHRVPRQRCRRLSRRSRLRRPARKPARALSRPARSRAHRRLQTRQLLRPRHGRNQHPSARRRSHRPAPPDLARHRRRLQSRRRSAHRKTSCAETVQRRTESRRRFRQSSGRHCRRAHRRAESRRPPPGKRLLKMSPTCIASIPTCSPSRASARFSAVNEYLVNSEGTVTRNGKTTYNVHV